MSSHHGNGSNGNGNGNVAAGNGSSKSSTVAGVVEMINGAGVHQMNAVSNGNPSLMKAFDKKAKGYLNALHRSFSTSAVEK